MRFSTIVVLVVAGVFAFTAGGRAEDAPKKYSMTGCLRAGSAPNTYMLSNRQIGAPRTAAIVSSKPELAPHLGHKVEITGTLVSAKDAEAVPNLPRATHYMDVTAIKTISATCP
jgi:hypothetical protein